jgi:hypothetical protein
MLNRVKFYLQDSQQRFTNKQVLYACGFSNYKEVAERLGYSESMIKQYANQTIGLHENSFDVLSYFIRVRSHYITSEDAIVFDLETKPFQLREEYSTKTNQKL